MKDKQIFKELDLVGNFLKSFPHVMNLSGKYYPYVIGLDKKKFIQYHKDSIKNII